MLARTTAIASGPAGVKATGQAAQLDAIRALRRPLRPAGSSANWQGFDQSVPPCGGPGGPASGGDGGGHHGASVWRRMRRGWQYRGGDQGGIVAEHRGRTISASDQGSTTIAS